MQRDIPRLHAILASKNKRIGELEHLLRETKDQANKECDRLREENTKLQRSFMDRLKEKEKDSKGERREEGREGGRKGGRKGGREGGREEGREGEEVTLQQIVLLHNVQDKSLTYQTFLHPVLSNS